MDLDAIPNVGPRLLQLKCRLSPHMDVGHIWLVMLPHRRILIGWFKQDRKYLFYRQMELMLAYIISIQTAVYSHLQSILLVLGF